MGKVHELAGGLLVSISTLAREFGMARETVSKRLEQSGVTPADEVKGYPVYRIAEAAKAILGVSVPGDSADPDKMLPQDRLAWMRSENERLKFEQSERRLVPIEEVEEQLAALVKSTIQLLATLPDRLERDAGLPPEAIERATVICDAAREQYHADLMA